MSVPERQVGANQVEEVSFLLPRHGEWNPSTAGGGNRSDSEYVMEKPITTWPICRPLLFLC